MQRERPVLTQVLGEINALLRAQTHPPLFLVQRVLTTYEHYSVREDNSRRRCLCEQLTARECGDWLRGFRAALLYEAAAATDAEKADASYS